MKMKLLKQLLLVGCGLVALVHALTAKELKSKFGGSSDIIKITDKNYERILNDRKDYSVLVYLTASSARVGCTLCSELLPIVNILGMSYLENLETLGEDQDLDKLFFAVADFNDNRKYFGEVGLQTVPKIFLYKPTLKRSSQNIVIYDEYNFVSGDHYSNIVNFITSKTQIPIDFFTIHEPTDYSKIITRVLVVALVITVIYKGITKFDGIFKSTFIYQLLSFLAIFSFTSGFMFNQIRHTPYSQQRNGETMYFVSGHQQQLGAETQIISIVYFGLFLACWFLISQVDKFKSARIKFISVLVLNLCIFILYSLLINFYHVKNSGYPFYLSKLF